MRTKKLGIGILAVLAIIALFAVAVSAGIEGYTCTIDRIGGPTQVNGSIYVNLTDSQGAFTNLAFKIPEARLNQMLAILLTAATNRSTVFVRADKETKVLSAVYYNVD